MSDPTNHDAFPGDPAAPPPPPLNKGGIGGVEREAGLLRVLGKPEAIALVVGTVIGSGIFFKPPTIASELGSFPAIIGVWIFAGILCLLGALCFAELAAMLPRAGGLYVYLREAYGRLPAFLFGWAEFWVVRPASIATLAVAFTLPLDWSEPARLSVSVSVVLLLAWVNVMGVLWGGKTQDATTLIKAGFLAGIAVLPFVVGGVDLSNFGSVGSSTGDGISLKNLAVALLAVLWAYNGWHEVTPVAEEIKDPQRNLPWALVVGVGTLIALYVGANLAYHGVFSISEVEGAKNVAVDVVNNTIGPVGGKVMTGLIMCSVFGAINGNMLYGPRIFFAMGRDRVFFPQLGRVHVTRHTPSYAIVAQTALGIALMFAARFIPHAEIAEDLALPPDQVRAIPAAYEEHFQIRPKPNEDDDEPKTTDAANQKSPTWQLVYRGTPMLIAQRDAVAALSDKPEFADSVRAAYERSNRSVFDFLSNLVVFGASIFYALTVAAVIILRFRQPDLDRPYRTWGYPAVPLFYIAFYGWFLFEIFRAQRTESMIGLVVIATGVPAYFIWRSALAPDELGNTSS